MNDRYLYRAKQTDNGELAEGYYVFCRRRHYILPICGKCGFDEREDYWTEIDPSTICQCTGLKDKHGKLIFENDIVRCGKNCTVTWCDTFASWRLNTSGWMYSHFFGEACKPEDVEIVGNIFDNPELLEVVE